MGAVRKGQTYMRGTQWQWLWMDKCGQNLRGHPCTQRRITSINTTVCTTVYTTVEDTQEEADHLNLSVLTPEDKRKALRSDQWERLKHTEAQNKVS